MIGELKNSVNLGISAWKGVKKLFSEAMLNSVPKVIRECFNLALMHFTLRSVYKTRTTTQTVVVTRKKCYDDLTLALFNAQCRSHVIGKEL